MKPSFIVGSKKNLLGFISEFHFNSHVFKRSEDLAIEELSELCFAIRIFIDYFNHFTFNDTNGLH
jgi:hypothetical protein